MQKVESPVTQHSRPREKLSAFIVCYNEEREILECLQTLQFCDEVVVVDSFSTDNTVAICEEFGARVIQRSWPGYRAQKAFGLAATSHQWVLNLDADERVSSDLQESIIRVLEEEYHVASDLEGSSLIGTTTRDSSTKLTVRGRPNGYEISRVVYYLGRWWRKGGWYPEYRVRLMRKSAVEWGGIDPHERPIVSGTIARISGELEHFTYRSMDEQVRRLHAHASIAAREEFAHSDMRVGPIKILINPIVRIAKFYILKKGYREGVAGLIVALMEGFYTFLKYAKVWEMQQEQFQKEVTRERNSND